MKNLTILVMGLIFMLVPLAGAQDLCVEPQITTGTYTIEIDGGTPIVDMPFIAYTDPDGDWHCIYDVGTLGAGDHTFRVMAVDASGWEGSWSDPFSAVRPGASTKWKIRK